MDSIVMVKVPGTNRAGTGTAVWHVVTGTENVFESLPVPGDIIKLPGKSLAATYAMYSERLAAALLSEAGEEYDWPCRVVGRSHAIHGDRQGVDILVVVLPHESTYDYDKSFNVKD